MGTMQGNDLITTNYAFVFIINIECIRDSHGVQMVLLFIYLRFLFLKRDKYINLG